MRKKIWAWIMTVAMIVTMMPASAFADTKATDADVKKYEVVGSGNITTDAEGLFTSKTLTIDEEKGTGTITLETYSKGFLEENEVSTPADIVLVLDVSGSMDDCLVCGGSEYSSNHRGSDRHEFQPRIDSLKDSVNSFIGTVNEQSLGADKTSADDDVDHRIAIVKFAGTKSNTVGDNTYTDWWGNRYNNSQIVKNLTSAKTGATELKDAVSDLEARGATAADYGMQHAQTIINGISDDRVSNKVVVMFTDGEPNHDSGFTTSVANDAIKASKDIKDKGATVYTVGIFSSTMSDDVTTYMNRTSSNYPAATGMDDNEGGTQASSDYYQVVSDTTALNKIFEKLKEELAKPQTELTSSSVVQDVLTSSFEFNGEGDVKGVTVKTAPYTGNDADGNPTWGDAVTAAGVTAAIDGKTVSVTGFDFANEYILVKDGKAQGSKLIIEIPVELTDKDLDGALLNSNAAGSGIYTAAGDQSPMRDFGSPQVQKAVEIKYVATTGGSVSSESEIVAPDGDAAGSTATADEEHYFVNWTNAEGKEVSTSATYVPPTEMATYTANFAPKTELTITAESAAKKYDGTPLTDGGYDVTGLKEGHKIAEGTVIVTGTITNVGTEANVVEAPKLSIVDASGNDVTNQYTVTTVNGTLTVTKRDVTLTSATASKVYDGTPLTNENITVGGDGFAANEGASYDVTGSQTNAGSSKNTFTYDLNRGTLAENYNITTAEGTLTVTKVEKEIVITADSDTKVYDGTALTDDGYTFTEGVLAEGDELVVEVEGTITNAGTAANKVASYKVMRGNEDVTANYTFGKSVDGTLKVTPRPVTMTSASASKVYDGTPLTDKNVTVEGFVKGEGASLNVTGSQTDVGTSDNKFTYELNEGTIAGNYTITTVEGKLTVTKVETVIVITADSDTKVYDGKPLTDAGYTYTENVLVKGDVLTAVVEGTQTDAGTAANKVVSYKVMRGETDVTGNYNFGESVNGTLTVTPRPVTLTSATDSKVYDGTPLTNNKITVGGDGFVEGEGAIYNVTGSQLDAGSSANKFTYELSMGTKAENYNITKTEGTLTVTKNAEEIVIIADSNSKVYDGTPLTDNGYTFTEDVLAEGDVLTAVVEGSQTDAGEAANVVTSYKVMRGETDVTANYTFGESVNGTLTVTKRPVTMTSATDSKVYDGTPLTNDTVTAEGFVEGEGASYDVTGSQLDVGNSDNAFAYTLNEGTKAENYEITQVKGTLTVTKIGKEIVITADSNSKTYDGEPLTDDGYTFTEDVLVKGDVLTAVVEGSQTDAGTAANEVTSYKVMRGDTDVTANYTFGKSVDGTLEVVKRNVTLTSATDEKVYDGEALTNDEITVTGDGFVKGEGASYDVTGSQLDVGSSDNEFTYELNEGTKAGNYNIKTVIGTLTVTPVEAKIVIKADSNEKVYDGTPLTDNGYTFTEDVLVKGDVLTAVVEGTITDAGEVANVVTSYKVMRGEEDVTANYTFGKSVDGTLKVTPRPVTLTSATDEKVYDGTPLTNDNVKVGGDGFVEGEGASYDVTGSQKNVGTSDNTFTYVLNDGTKPGNYDITTKIGTLTVTPVETKIVIKADSNEKVYDGTPLTDDGYTYTEDVLVEGDKLVVEIKGTITDAGETANKVASYKVMCGEEDVTANYTFGESVDGTLTVTKRPVTMTSATDSKVYDGTPLTNETVTAEGFVEGEGASYKVTGSQTDVGTSDNTFKYDLNRGTKAGNYEITQVEGTLTVTKIGKEIVITADSNSKTYDGEPLTDDGYTFTDGVLVEGDELVAVVEGSQTDVGTAANEVTSYKVMRGNDDVTANYTFGESVDGTLEVVKRNVTLTSATDSKVYDGEALTNDEITVGGDGFVKGEGAEYDVTGSQLDVGSSDNEFTYELNEGTKAGNYNITTKNGTLTVTPVEAAIVITADSNEKVYDGTPLTDDGYTFTDNVLKKGDVLTAVVEGSITDAGETVNKVTSYKVMRGDTDVTANYTFGESVDGTLKVTPRPVTITSATDSKVYDGTPLTNDTVTAEGFVEGEGAEYDVTGSQRNVGTSDNTFTYELNEGTKAGNYSITTKVGTLTVTPITTEIVITADSNEKVYDGTPLTDDGYTYTEDVLAEGDTLVVEVEGTQTDVGEAANTVTSYKVVRGEEDVTANYTFGKSVDGTLKVTPRTVTMTSATDSKEYDGTPLTNDTVTVEGFVEGEGASYDVTGSQLDVGSSSNTFTYTLNENTKAGNYEITQIEGTLTITKIVAQILITADSNEKVYDGTELTDDGYSFDEDMLKNGDKLTAVVEGTQTDAGTSANVVTSYKVMRGETDVTANYNIATQDGTLTVTKRPVTLTSATDSKEYDGKPLTNSEVTVGGDGFAPEEGASYDVTGSQRDVGSSSNAFTYALNEGTNADNYVITVVEGTLTVVPVGTEIVIVADSNTKMYDGTPLTDDGYTFTEDVLVEGDVLTAVVEGSQTNAGDSANTVTSYVVMRGEEDVTANYKIATADGKLTVTPRVVTLTSATETKFYDGTPLTNDEITVGGDGFVEGEGASYDVTGTVTNVAEGQVENEFTYVAAEGTDLENYEITTSNGTLEIAPVVLVVAADSKTKYQGEANPELTGSITGFINGETVETALTGAPEYATTAEKNSPVGEYPITAGEGTLVANNGNYIFQYLDGTLTVIEKPAVPDDEAPTGDGFNIWMYAGLALAALFTALAALFIRRKPNKA